MKEEMLIELREKFQRKDSLKNYIERANLVADDLDKVTVPGETCHIQISSRRNEVDIHTQEFPVSTDLAKKFIQMILEKETNEFTELSDYLEKI